MGRHGALYTCRICSAWSQFLMVVKIAGFAALGFVLVNTIMGNMVEPRLMGKGMGLSTLVVFLSLIFWGWLLGTVGMLLSVPLTMVEKMALESREESKWLAVLLSNRQQRR